MSVLDQDGRNERADGYQIDAVARALLLLGTVSKSHTALPLAELVARLPWSKATTYRLVRTLEAWDILHRTEEGYLLGPALIIWGQHALAGIELNSWVKPHLEAMYRKVDENCNIGVLSGDDIIYIARVENRQILTERLDVGSSHPAYCTSLGHVLLAGKSDEEVAERLADCEFERLAPNTLGSLDELRARLNQVRSRGYAMNNEELATGLRSVAAPIRDHDDSVIAAVSVGVPVARASRDRLENEFAPIVLDAARRISEDLGHRQSLD